MITALAALLRYRAMVPLMFLILLGEALGRRAIVWGYEGVGLGSSPIGLTINLGLLALLALGLILSLTPRQRAP